MPVAQASDGTVGFSGLLLNTTCTLSVNGGSNVGTVTLPSLSTAALGAAGATAGRTNFTISMSACNQSVQAFLSALITAPLYGANTTLSSAKAYFQNGAGVDPVSHNILNASGTATGVQLQLVDAGGGVIKVGDSSQTQAVGVPISSGANIGTGVMYYAVQYIANAATTPGSVVGSVTYSIAYN
jgi:major type 1 subunit fimbrin (pilin)